MFKIIFFLIILSNIFFLCCTGNQKMTWQNSWECQVFPPEYKVSQDEESGAKVVFVTTNPAKDLNLYFDLNCWTADLSLLVFSSDRNGRNELFGYLPETGELVQLQEPGKSLAGNATVDFSTQDIYVVRDNTAYQWRVTIEYAEGERQRSRVSIRERRITSAPEGCRFFMGFTQSADGRALSAGLSYTNSDKQDIVSIDIASGALKTLYTGKGISHVQFNKYNNNYLRFSGSPHRMWFIDTRQPGVVHKLHLQESGELVTHEDWWVNDQMTFCGAYRKEESHVKVIDLATQTTRIIGAGSWWPDKSPAELSEYNWWHASGSRDGRWVAADNWHGHIAIIDGRTSHLRILTKNHRTYGDVAVEHPHVGWAPDSKSVEFTSHKRGNADVCIIYLPEKWSHPFMRGEE